MTLSTFDTYLEDIRRSLEINSLEHPPKNTIAVIPARAGSSLAHKNTRTVDGIPLISRAVNACVYAGVFDKIIVNTDCGRVRKAVQSLAHRGVELQERPPELAGDDVTSEAVLAHVLKDEPHCTCAFVQCTSPFIRFEDLADAVMLQRSYPWNDSGTIMSVVPTHYHQWMEHGDGMLAIESGAYHISEHQRLPRQQSRKRWRETGAFYIFDSHLMLHTGRRWTGITRGYEVPAWTGVEIDEEEDFALAQWLSDRNERAQ